MFFVARGLVQVTVVIDSVERPLEQLGAGGAFGEGPLVRKSQQPDVPAKRSTSVVTMRFCELLSLSSEDFEWLRSTFGVYG